MAQQVQFVYLTQSEFDGISSKSNGKIYFTSDTKRIYKGKDLYAATTFDQLDFDSIEVNQLTVSGSAVSLEGHSHTTSDISDLVSFIANATSGFASTGHSHVELSGITSSSIYKETATFGNLTVTGEVTMSLSEVTFGSVIASDISVNGSQVALEGHTHSIDDIEDYQDNTFWITGSVNIQTQEIQVDQSFSDAVEAADAGKHIRAKMDYTGNGSYVCPWVNTIYNINGSAVAFDFHIMLDSNVLNPDHNRHPYLISATWNSNGFTMYPYELSETDHGHIELSGITESSISKTSATFQDLTVTGDVTFSVDQLDFQSLTASSIVVDGKSVSLEGHGHVASDISDFGDEVVSVGASTFASISHVHSMSEVQGLESKIVDVSCITQSQYDSLESKVSGTIYFLTDTQRIYRGETFYGGATMDELQCTSLSTSNLMVDGTPVSLEGHVHSASDISDFANAVVSAGTSAFASASHSHDGLQGLTSNSISKDFALFNSISASAATFDNLVVTGDVSLSLSQVQFGSIVASDISVNGSSVSLEGHMHGASEISGIESMIEKTAITKSALAAQVSGLSLSSDATQKTIRETLQSIISALQTMAGTICLAFMAWFLPFMANAAIEQTTKWEDVPPSTSMSELSELANDEDLTIVKYTDGTILATNFTGTIGYNTIPNKSSIKKIRIGKGVTSIGASVFQVCSNLMSVTIPDGVTSIGNSAFRNCSKLTSVTIPNSVTNIGGYAFNGCAGLTRVMIGSGIQTIDATAFLTCPNLKSITFLGKSTEEVKALSNYPWNIPSTCKIYAMKDVNEVAVSSKKYPLFIIDLNPSETRYWTGVELKATTNNFVNNNGNNMLFFTASAANGTTVPGIDFTYDWCRLFVPSKRSNSDVRKWQRITNTSDINGYAPLTMAILVDPTLFKRSQGDAWLSDDNEELTWSYTKIGLESEEKDQDGVKCWRAIMPVKWYSSIPSWANESPVTPDGSNVTPYDGDPGRNTSLRGQTFDFSNMKGMYNAVSNIVTSQGGTVTNFPTFNQ